MPVPPRLLAGVAASVLVASAVTGWRLTSPGDDPLPPHPQSIAILPFKPVVDEHRNEAMELGMADSLSMERSRSEHLIVRPLSATRRFVGPDPDPRAAGRAHDARAGVDGALHMA